VADAAIAADLLEAPDIRLHLAAKFAFNLAVLLDLFAQTIHLRGRQVVGADALVDLDLLQDLAGRLAADAVNVGQRDLDPFVGQCDAGDACIP